MQKRFLMHDGTIIKQERLYNLEDHQSQRNLRVYQLNIYLNAYQDHLLDGDGKPPKYQTLTELFFLIILRNYELLLYLHLRIQIINITFVLFYFEK